MKSIPENLIINADDLGKNRSVNAAIFKSFDSGYINSASLMVNFKGFKDAVDQIKQSRIRNIGLHVDLVEGKPVSDFNHTFYLKEDGTWNSSQFWKVKTYSFEIQKAIELEISTQLEIMQKQLFQPMHINSHHHMHTLPTLFSIFLKIAQRHGIKLRLAQSYNEGNMIKYGYRKLINKIIKGKGLAFTDNFETIDSYVSKVKKPAEGSSEIMVHPGFDKDYNLIDLWEKTNLKEDFELLFKSI